ncbi:MAG TPA: DNA-3-methyladenine glycosylase [Cyclobacteriaceae bacterium]|nr:DNA-3-methyladenine glycosylase [Cyclobacteriaceae bacterium]
MNKLRADYYQQEDVCLIARDLLGKVIVSRQGTRISSGIIVETEAYSFLERGCHAYQNKRTPRTEVMFAPGGHAYVYLCYGMHHLFNVVTNKKDIAEAVLIRAIEPLEGIDLMQQRRGNVKSKYLLSSGPARLTKALGIDLKHNTIDLSGNQIWLEDRNINYSPKELSATPRIGIDYAGADAKKLWRFIVKSNEWLSKK